MAEGGRSLLDFSLDDLIKKDKQKFKKTPKPNVRAPVSKVPDPKSETKQKSDALKPNGGVAKVAGEVVNGSSKLDLQKRMAMSLDKIIESK